MRAPAEYYIRYRLVRDAAKPLGVIEEDLNRDLVFPPHKDTLQRLRDEMQIPTKFNPRDLLDHVSQAFLRRHRIWSMWHPRRGTKEAVEIFRDRRARALLQTLISSPTPEQGIFEIFLRKAKLPLSDQGLSEFRHYFWNISLLNVQELQNYTSMFLKDPILQDVIDAKSTPEHMLLALSHLGIVPQVMDEVAMLESYRTMCFLDSIATQKGVKPGLSRATAINLGLKGVLEAGKAIRDIRIERGEEVDQFDKYDPQVIDLPIPDLEQLGKGVVPIPAAWLNLEEVRDKEEKAGG